MEQNTMDITEATNQAAATPQAVHPGTCQSPLVMQFAIPADFIDELAEKYAEEMRAHDLNRATLAQWKERELFEMATKRPWAVTPTVLE